LKEDETTGQSTDSTKKLQKKKKSKKMLQSQETTNFLLHGRKYLLHEPLVFLSPPYQQHPLALSPLRRNSFSVITGSNN
jgi:hypothetical protein